MPLIVDGRRTTRTRLSRLAATALSPAGWLRSLLLMGLAGYGILAPVSTALADSVPPSADMCGDVAISHPFLAFGDPRDYALVPGQVDGNFTGGGWSFTGAAGVLDDGTGRQVLDLPSESTATSPAVCVNSAYPTARAMIRNVRGGEGVQFYVSYAQGGAWTKPKNTGQIHGQQGRWTASDNLNLQPGPSDAWQIVRFSFRPGGKTSDFQIYDFYVDPYAKR